MVFQKLFVFSGTSSKLTETSWRSPLRGSSPAREKCLRRRTGSGVKAKGASSTAEAGASSAEQMIRRPTHKDHLTSKLNSKTVPVLPSLDPSLIFPFLLIPSPVHPTGFSFCFFPGFLAILICCPPTLTGTC